jgi:addiction module HigA family antidote
MEKVRIAYHPGEYLLKELKARKWSQAKFAELLGITKAEVNDLIKGRRNITPRLALRIGAAFGASPDLWIHLQNRYDVYLASKDKGEIQQLIRIKVQSKELCYA